MNTTVHSEQRTQLIKVTLRCVQGLALAMIGLAAYVLVRALGDVSDMDGVEDRARQSAFLLVMVLVVQAAVLVTMTVWTLRRLPARSAEARVWSLATGALVLVSSLPIITSLLGIGAVFLGLFLLTTAARRDRED